MSLEYSKAKNNSQVCKWNNVFLHSSYNPEVEAKRFVDSLHPNFVPENIVILEPALSYCASYLKEKFPYAKLFAVRFTKEISQCSLFIKEFIFESSDMISNLQNDLYNYFGETGLLNSFFISWPPSSKAFSGQDAAVWNMLKGLLKNCQNILATRQFFAERWIKNQINILSNINHVSTLSKTELPVLVCASGNSLKKSIPYIKKMQNAFYIIACSSSIYTLLYNDIKPDLCISTDGGFWAKKHLFPLLNYNEEIKLAVSTESNIPLKLLSKENIKLVPVSYGDNFDESIFNHMNIPFVRGKRNGTISGTAVELALSLTQQNIYMCGIDLEAAEGFVHTQPNILEIENSVLDNKLRSKEKRTFIQGRDSTQLEVYRDWFISNSHQFCKRVYRISDSHNFLNRLGEIKDITFNDIINNDTKTEKKYDLEKTISLEINKQDITDCFNQLLCSKEWLKNYFPADYIMIERSTDEESKKLYQKKLNDKINKIKNYLKKLES